MLSDFWTTYIVSAEVSIQQRLQGLSLWESVSQSVVTPSFIENPSTSPSSIENPSIVTGRASPHRPESPYQHSVYAATIPPI